MANKRTPPPSRPPNKGGGGKTASKGGWQKPTPIAPKGDARPPGLPPKKDK
jgi:hypothetical protein